MCLTLKAVVPVHFQRDGSVDDGEAEHPDPAQQDAPERAGLEVHDENLRTQNQRYGEWNPTC